MAASQCQSVAMNTNQNRSEPHDDQRLTFTYEQTARAASVSVGLIRKRVRSGEIEAIRIGRCVRIPRRALLKLCGILPADEN